MFKPIAVSAFVLSLGMAGPAYADKLHPKWEAPRKEANRLGDAAKAGDTSAVTRLKQLAASGTGAPAAHNLGWLLEQGVGKTAANGPSACTWYRQAAEQSYPPALHSYAEKCLFVKSKGRGSKDEFETKAIALMLQAAEAGWTKSAIHLGEYLLNLPRLKTTDANKAREAAGYGLKSNPTALQKTTLSYLKGMAVIYGRHEKRETRYEHVREGGEALRYASTQGHVAAKKALPRLRSSWVSELIRQLPLWRPPNRSAEECIKIAMNPKDKNDASTSCYVQYTIARGELAQLTSDANYLLRYITGPQKEKLVLNLENLEQRATPFRAEEDAWQNRFKPAYGKR